MRPGRARNERRRALFVNKMTKNEPKVGQKFINKGVGQILSVGQKLPDGRS